MKRRKECEDAVESPQLRADGNLNLSTAFNFDRLHATRLVEARQALLREILPAYVQEHGLRTALDAGCGVGYFSAFLRDMGFEVSAFDARLQNVEEARRHPRITFSIANMEDQCVGFCSGMAALSTSSNFPVIEVVLDIE